MKKRYDSTIARIAGNLLSGMPFSGDEYARVQARTAVYVARLIVAEVERTEPVETELETLRAPAARPPEEPTP